MNLRPKFNNDNDKWNKTSVTNHNALLVAMAEPASPPVATGQYSPLLRQKHTMELAQDHL